MKVSNSKYKAKTIGRIIAIQTVFSYELSGYFKNLLKDEKTKGVTTNNDNSNSTNLKEVLLDNFDKNFVIKKEKCCDNATFFINGKEVILPLYYDLDSLFNNEEISSESKEFAFLLVSGVVNNINYIDDLIKKYLLHWELERLNNVDKAILRVSLFELIFLKTGSAVVIDEAIEISKIFSSENSFRFINGILDKIVEDLGLKEKNDIERKSKKSEKKSENNDNECSEKKNVVKIVKKKKVVIKKN